MSDIKAFFHVSQHKPTYMNIENLSQQEKVDLLKELVDDLDIILTASYGATGTINSSNIEISDRQEKYTGINIGTIVIHTGIMTG